MLGNNEKIQGVSIPDLFSAMLAELPWRVLHKYITDNAQLMKICTLGGHRVDPQQRPRLMRQVQKTDCERKERRKRGVPVIFLLGMRLRAV